MQLSPNAGCQGEISVCLEQVEEIRIFCRAVCWREEIVVLDTFGVHVLDC
jgi:hypothetical protein